MSSLDHLQSTTISKPNKKNIETDHVSSFSNNDINVDNRIQYITKLHMYSELNTLLHSWQRKIWTMVEEVCSETRYPSAENVILCVLPQWNRALGKGLWLQQEQLTASTVHRNSKVQDGLGWVISFSFPPTNFSLISLVKRNAWKHLCSTKANYSNCWNREKRHLSSVLPKVLLVNKLKSK